MQTINDRIAEFIRTAGLKKIDFARDLNVTPAMVSRVCSGQSGVSDRTVADICRIYGVREAWLRTGEGEMLEARTPGDEVGAIVADALRGQPEEARAYFEQLLAGLTDGEILLLREVARRFVSRRDAERQTNKQPPQD